MKQTLKPTVLNYAILGLIRQEPLSGYQIRKIFESSPLGNYSSSPGSIYPALKRLDKLGLVEKIMMEGKNKARIQITPKGLDILKEWLLLPPHRSIMEKNVNELLLRFAFMDPLVKKDQQLRFLTSFRDLLKPYITELKDYRKKESLHMTHSGHLAYEHGILSYQATLEWCEIAIEKLNKNISE